jgi:hypothetical protein
MAKKPTEGRRKLVEFDAPTWHALNLLSRESLKSFQDLADEAFRNLLRVAHPLPDHERVSRGSSMAVSATPQLKREPSPVTRFGRIAGNLRDFSKG